MRALPTASYPADLDLDYVEFYVADVEATAAAFQSRYGFTLAGCAGSAAAGFRSLALTQGAMTLVLTEATIDDHPATAYVLAHGDGIADIALRTGDVTAAFTEAVRRGGRPIAEPAAHSGKFPTVTATIGGFGDVVHTLVERSANAEDRLPVGFTPLAATGTNADAPLLAEVDHFAVCVPADELDLTIAYYREVFGFEETFTERIAVGAQAMNSKVAQSVSRTITFTVIEPDTSADPGQIDAFLKRHGGAGVQHLAFSTEDAVHAVRTLADRGVQFLSTPGAYYDALAQRVAPKAHSIAQLRELSLLIDEDHGGQLFQIFTRSTHEKKTLFYEVIERIGAETFGSSNIKALYEAVEVERLRSEDAS
ncbi:4-hydroxyphenylpyruvate dioxygenase [Kitasatospora kifunensis]|uniref:4-hydroxymandelate synthase n=1 Tax=Kitasatospora kifunensis TaxID=58351 RepID=A0A7W7R878_KITKI|nr:4-hydroxyphenylpyruvate dioxygenase [Kitasatospora kifunensis]MBB4926933.1 4-hydroxymandelate synthase [Kitasatospora kifunensis]